MTATFDFSPFFRSSVGFDRVFNLLENAARVDPLDNWPPYDIARIGEDVYQISMAVAGFTQNDITISQEANSLCVSGAKAGEDQGDYLHRGIANRAFKRRFNLADHVKVTGASLENGMLTIQLLRELPEEMRPRRIAIEGAPSKSNDHVRQIDGNNRAA